MATDRTGSEPDKTERDAAGVDRRAWLSTSKLAAARHRELSDAIRRARAS
ncbi:MAG: hypothetical protein QOF04_2981 [Solirubrobacteraceae bacterium]|jgi:hypothetical protein|nr:hypothetical protein [Solirubrobacteraceae bacterium]